MEKDKKKLNWYLKKKILFQLVSKNEQNHAETWGLLGHNVGEFFDSD